MTLQYKIIQYITTVVV